MSFGAGAAGARVAYRDCGTLEWLPMDRSDLLKELHIDRDARPGRARSRRLVVAGVALLAIGGALWLGLGRAATPAVRTAVARAATGESGRASCRERV